MNISTGLLVSTEFYQKNMWYDNIPYPYSDFDSILLIYAITSKFTRITCYPVETNEVWKFSIKLKAITASLAEQIASIFKTTKLIHTTGICEEKNILQIENYIQSDQNKNRIQTILVELQEIPEIENVINTTIKKSK